MREHSHESIRKVRSLLARQRRLRAAAGGLRLLWILVGLHLFALGILGWLSLRHPLSTSILGLMAWSYAVYALLPAAWWIRWSGSANAPEAVARDLDRSNPSAPDPFRTVLSLHSHGEDTLGHLNRIFASELPRLAIPRPAYLPRLHLLILAAGLAACVVSALLSGRPGEFFRRAFLPRAALEGLPSLRFEFEPPNAVLGLGDTALVRGRILNLIPGQALFAHVRSAAGETRYPLSVDSNRSFAFSHGPAEGDFSVMLAGANGRSAALRFRVLPRPSPSSLRAIATPPGYTRLRPDTLPPGVAHFPVLPGTRVDWVLESDRDLRRMAWKFAPAGAAATGGDPAPAGPSASGIPFSMVVEDTSGSGRSHRASRVILVPTDYSFWLEDEHGIRSAPFTPYRVDIIPDLAPEVDLVTPSADTVLGRDAVMGLAFRVKDDFGIASLKLSYRVLAGGKVRRQGQRDGRDWLKAARAGLVRADWDLKSLELGQDEMVEFHLAAVDNDTVNGPKTGRSATRILRMPSLRELLAAARESEQSAVANLKSALQREKQLERKLELQNQSPREEYGPPMLSEWEINRIMVEAPRDHQRRSEAVMAQMNQSLARMAKEKAGGGKGKAGESGWDMPQAQAAARDLSGILKQAESALPRGNQGMVPAEERRKNLDDLIEAQKKHAEALAGLRKKLEKAPNGLAPMDLAKRQAAELAGELEKNIRNQDDLRKLLQDQAAQAKAKSDLMDQAIQEQMRMVEDMKGATEDLDKAMEQGRKNGLLSPELLEKMQKVQELLKEVLPDSLQRMLESKLQGQEVDEEELREKLREMLEKQAELTENLNRALAMLEQLKDRKRMEELRQELRDLQAREKSLQKQLEEGKTGATQEAGQKSIAEDTRRALSDFASEAEGRKALEEARKALSPGPVQKDMQDVSNALAEAAKAASGAQKSAAAAAAAKSAASAASRLGEMGEQLGAAMGGMENAVDLSEVNELLQESLALSRLQLLIRAGAARRKAEGWESDEAALYRSVAQTAQWLDGRVKILAGKVPFLGAALTGESRNLAAAAREASRQYSWDIGDKSLKHNQNLSRELLKLLKMAQAGGGGSGGSSGGEAGAGAGAQGGDLSGQLQGMSGKQMAINQATYQLLQAMMEGRRGGKSGSQSGAEEGEGGEGGENGERGEGAGPGRGQGPEGQGGEGRGLSGGDGSSPGSGGEGTLGSMANRQGELGEGLESLAESLGDEGGPAQKLRSLAEEARRLEEDLRAGRMTPEEMRRRQERFQTRLLEASNAMQERGESEKRQAETGRGNPADAAGAAKPADETRLLRLLREARREARDMDMSEGQRRYLEDFYESLLTR